jgi:hypothetical protein
MELNVALSDDGLPPFGELSQERLSIGRCVRKVGKCEVGLGPSMLYLVPYRAAVFTCDHNVVDTGDGGDLDGDTSNPARFIEHFDNETFSECGLVPRWVVETGLAGHGRGKRWDSMGCSRTIQLVTS